MNRKTYSQVLNDVAQDGIPADLNLTPKIIARVQKGKSVTMKPRNSFAVLLVLIVVLMTATAVAAAAIQRWFGYVPGFGLISNGQLRELAEPVSITQDGFTLKVDQVILSSERTLVMYSLDGITADMLADPGCFGENYEPVLRLPDGSELELKGSLSSDTHENEVTFAPMPANISEATLIINCIDYVSPGQVPQHWEVPLQFVTASPDLTVVPVLDASATTESSLTATAPREGLMLNNVIPLQEGYILSGTIMVVPPAGYTVVENYGGYLEDATITDASGQVLAFDTAPDDFINSMLPSALPENTHFWAGHVHGQNIQWPLTITVHSLTARGPLLPQAEFQIDVGQNPKAGQVWKLYMDVPLGTKTARIISVEYINDMHGLSLDGYEFTLVDDPTLDFWLEIKGAPLRMGGGGASNEDGTHTLVLSYSEPVPAGMLTVIVHGNELIQLTGPWQATWQMPAAGKSPTP